MDNLREFAMMTILSILLILSIYSCSAPVHMSYAVHSYTGHEGEFEDIQGTSHFMSYKGNLIEFRLSVRYIDSIKPDGSRLTLRTEYDTVGAYYLFPELYKFVEFDGFRSNAKVLNRGLFSEKHDGLPLRDRRTIIDTVLKSELFRDSIFNGIKVKVAQVRMPDGIDGAKRAAYFYLSEGSKFTSVFNSTSFLKQRPDWTVVGVFVIDLGANHAYMTRLEDLRRSDSRSSKIFDVLASRAKEELGVR
jgi:hypothetical protein